MSHREETCVSLSVRKAQLSLRRGKTNRTPRLRGGEREGVRSAGKLRRGEEVKSSKIHNQIKSKG